MDEIILPPLGKLEGECILITGATGLIGNCIVKLLMNTEIQFSLYASGRNKARAEKLFSKYSNDTRFHFLKYDVNETLESEIDFHYIIHAASGANPKVYATDPVGVMTANFLGVNNLLSYGVNHNLRRFLYISSDEVYGEGDGRVFTEDYSGYVDSMSPRSCYPSSKRAAETLCAAYSKQYGMDCVVARPCHIYGPQFTETDNRVFAQFIRNVLNGEDIIMKSAGNQYRSWCYVEDCASALLYILLKGKNGEAYNIADAASDITIRELAEMVAEIGGRKVVMQLPDEMEKAGFNIVRKSVSSTEKLESLGWRISGTMREKMEKTINILLNGKKYIS